ncbi:MAG TPA: hypothetical protein PKY58_13365 [Syntrophales bacterium]|nr:hypothetical protein [Syntrophales bacterium]HPX12176.1 hypothetical protein [Syntrophales bacterium]HQB31438.1 hypothetical protein [Syntrophales bacterium]HQN78210.1 hypothetical protein [Syntrophales bacterium]HQQ28507.1 hypothetical protein [Syntrophales bacterium]
MPSFTRSVSHAILLVLAGVVVAAVTNFLRPGGLPWKGDWSAQAQRELSLRGFDSITRGEYEAMEREGRLVLLDPRGLRLSGATPSPGSLNLSPGDVPPRIGELRVLSDAGMVLVVLCESERCALGAELAATLRKNGFSAFRVFRWEKRRGPPGEILPEKREGT